MNKICNLLKFNYEFKLHEIYDTNKRSFIQIICCINKINNLAICLNFDYADEKLMQLRSFYSQLIEEVVLFHLFLQIKIKKLRFSSL
jgi:hypothetical protein